MSKTINIEKVKLESYNNGVDDLAEQICNKVADIDTVSILMPDGSRAELVTIDYISELAVDLADTLKRRNNKSA